MTDRLTLLARQHRVAIERELGRRSFRQFLELAWPWIEPDRFVANWHIDLIAETLQAMATRQHREVLICIPPRQSKSLLVSVAFPAWVWTWWPAAKFITASYDLRLAHRDALKCRMLVESPWYKERWGDTTTLAPDQNQKGYYRTTAGGHRWSCSPTSGVTGEGADIILFDDPHNVAQGESQADREAAKRLWFEAMPSRLNSPKYGVKAVIQQRVHEDDVAGECIRRGYHHVVLPASFEVDHPQRNAKDPRTREGEPLNPARFDAEAIERLSKEMGTYAAAGQLQQRPVPREGGMFKRHWFEVVGAAPANLEIVRRWDLAGSEATAKTDPDWTVGLKMGRCRNSGLYYILDVIRLRKGPHEVEKAIQATASLDGGGVRIGLPIDPGQAGKAQFEYLVRQLAGYVVQGERETGDKATRASPFASQSEAGNVKLVRGLWNEEFLQIVGMFPAGAHDDDVDAAAGAFRMLTTAKTGLLDFYGAQTAASAA